MGLDDNHGKLKALSILIFALLVSLLRDFHLSTFAWYIDRLRSWVEAHATQGQAAYHCILDLFWANFGPQIIITNMS